MKKFKHYVLYQSNLETHFVSIVDHLTGKDKTNISVQFMNLAHHIIILSKQHNSILSAVSHTTVFCIKEKKTPQFTTRLGYNTAKNTHLIINQVFPSSQLDWSC